MAVRIGTVGGAVVGVGVVAALLTYSLTMTMSSVRNIVLPLFNLTLDDWRNRGLLYSAVVGVGAIAVVAVLLVIGFVVYQKFFAD